MSYDASFFKPFFDPPPPAVHYTGYLAATGDPFLASADETRHGEPAVVVAGRGESEKKETDKEGEVGAGHPFPHSPPPRPFPASSLAATGLNAAVATMCPGEVAHVWTTAAYGYGDKGSFSFPSVPPSASLAYRVHLVAADPPSDDVPLRDMTYEERLDASARRRGEGNDALAGGDPATALTKYALALSYVDDDDFLFQLHGRHHDAATAAVRAARLNAAAAKLTAGDPRGAAADATTVLADDPDNAKALFRRGVARRRLGDAPGAVADLKRAARAAPRDGGVRRELAAALAEERATAAAGDAVVRAAFRRDAGAARVGEEEGTDAALAPKPAAVAAADGTRRDAAFLALTFIVALTAAVAVVAYAAARWVAT